MSRYLLIIVAALSLSGCQVPVCVDEMYNRVPCDSGRVRIFNSIGEYIRGMEHEIQASQVTIDDLKAKLSDCEGTKR